MLPIRLVALSLSLAAAPSQDRAQALPALSMAEVHSLAGAGLGATLDALLASRGMAEAPTVSDLLALRAAGLGDETLAALVRVGGGPRTAVKGLDVSVKDGVVVVAGRSPDAAGARGRDDLAEPLAANRTPPPARPRQARTRQELPTPATVTASPAPAAATGLVAEALLDAVPETAEDLDPGGARRLPAEWEAAFDRAVADARHRAYLEARAEARRQTEPPTVVVSGFRDACWPAGWPVAPVIIANPTAAPEAEPIEKYRRIPLRTSRGTIHVPN